MSTKIITSHVFCNFTVVHDHSTSSYCCLFPSSNLNLLNASKHSCDRTKLVNSFHSGTKPEVTYKVMCSSTQDHQEPAAPTPRKSDFPEWKKWTLGILLSIVLPSFGHKMGPLLLLKSKVDTAIEIVEQVTEVVEEIAEATEEIAQAVEEKLPEDSRLKKDVEVLKNLSKKAVEEANETQELIHQIKDAEEQVIESLMGPGTDQPEAINKETRNKGL